MAELIRRQVTLGGQTFYTAFTPVETEDGPVELQVFAGFSDGQLESLANPKATVVHRALAANHTVLPTSEDSATLIDPNDHRHAYQVFNNSDGVLYIKAGTGCTPDSFSHLIQPAMGYEPSQPSVYLGEYTYCTAPDTTTGDIQVTEYE